MKFGDKLLNKNESHWLDSFFKTNFAEIHYGSQNGLAISADESQVARSLNSWIEKNYPQIKPKSKKNEYSVSTPEYEVEKPKEEITEPKKKKTNNKKR